MISPNSWSASFYKKPLKIEGVILGDTVEGQGNELLLFRRQPVLALLRKDFIRDFVVKIVQFALFAFDCTENPAH